MNFVLSNIRSTYFRIFESLRVALRYYHHIPFLCCDLLLASHYVWKNPHRVSKAFLKKMGEKNLHAYGETPLTTLDYIAKECQILSQDTLFELGCGTGRTLFWLRHFVRCQCIGVDHNPIFIGRAAKIKDLLCVDKVTFRLESMFEIDLQEASVIYLYGTCLEDEMIEKLVARFKHLSSGTKVITVSYSLTDYTTAFRVEKYFTARFPWGKAYVFLNIKV